MAQLEQSFLKLVGIMDELREKCPWDRKQTIETLRPLTLEETYELTDAITDKNWSHIKEELGDLLLHIIFYAKIGAEQQQFSLEDVIEGVSNKLISRHPHIYADTVVQDEEDVKKNWEQIKMKEGKKSVLSGVPPSLPAIVKASRIQDKATQVGFEWENKEDVWKKVEEEMMELQEAVAENDAGHIEEEFGDVLFSLVNYARFLQVDAEGVLEKTNKKFIHRFTLMEEEAAKQNRSLAAMSLAEMDAIWNDIKKQRKPS
ncbi:nucleoside triphosphate pyrophosphohydrolase [Segetibacter sp. 3557_3]|uniref:nucleoside triphosphate pyrophosphohydrolase n=1 Tax=Segetibacter sp. 3557_3 TaxID=2547429 RepID=UPI001058D968|nr:nucleoside triphosphate pyrophosphohydrolase [Segetibacter sp. 3557_3]TDH27795.1 nucleoside triphosphate pyrophosphohydrolase [Segetibacter sp. 3557_3]